MSSYCIDNHCRQPRCQQNALSSCVHALQCHGNSIPAPPHQPSAGAWLQCVQIKVWFHWMELHPKASYTSYTLKTARESLCASHASVCLWSTVVLWWKLCYFTLSNVALFHERQKWKSDGVRMAPISSDVTSVFLMLFLTLMWNIWLKSVQFCSAVTIGCFKASCRIMVGF